MKTTFHSRRSFFLWLIAQLSCSVLTHAEEASSRPEGNGDLTVMTRNLYIGSSFASLLAATTPEQVPLAIAKSYAEVLRTDIRTRAAAWADEIARAAPDLVGLQEAVLFRAQFPGDFLVGNPVQASTARIDFVQLLLEGLATRGAHYRVVATLDGFDLELPSITGEDIRITDRDVILARTNLPPGGLTILDTRTGEFATSLQIPVPGGQFVAFKRGWVSADVRVGGRVIRFLSTHLERLSPAARLAQARELLAGPANTDLPLLFVGDFNSDATVPEITYRTLLAAGFSDVWTATRLQEAGLTCCQQADLRNPLPTFSERIDLILTRGTRFDPVQSELVGEELPDHLPSGLWPSDHAGLVARIRIK
jgi:endonuclease/exonuclease/phosphatase family metal-dependent hydrolase